MTAQPFSSLGPCLETRAADGSRLVITPYGGQVLGWSTPDGRERLFVSATATTADGQAIRGGVPVCWPQFSGQGPLPKHGLLRNRDWSVLTNDIDGDGRARIALRCEADAVTRAQWPHAFAATLVATVGGDTLELVLTVRNTDAAPFSFTTALHGYWRVAELADVSLHGLEGHAFRDFTGAAGGAAGAPSPAALRFGPETDRVYTDAPQPLTLDTGHGRLAFLQTGFTDTVVWNPGAERAAAIGDLEADGWRRFVCVEAARIAVPVTLAPGAAWTGTQTVRALD